MNFKKSQIILAFIFILLSVRITYSQVQYGHNKEIGKFITLNGAKHYYEVYGQGEPLLLIHGNKTPIEGFAFQIEYFSKKYKVYAIDCRGRGKSELGSDTLSYIQIAKDMAEFIKQLNLKSVYIIGKSDGAVVGLLMAIYYPEQLKKIAAWAPNISPDTLAFFPESINGIHEERVYAEKMLDSKDTTENWLIEKQRYRMMEFQPHISAAELNRIKIPVLVMSCDRDVIKEEHILFIYKNIKNSNLCIFPGETHSMPKVNPILFNTTVDSYFSKEFQGHETRFK